MENTLENKAKFFAQHLLPGNEFELITQSYYDESDPTASMGIAEKSTGFRFKYDFLITPKAFRYCNGIFPLNMIDKSCIIRKHLSSITDEDAVEVAKIAGLSSNNTLNSLIDFGKEFANDDRIYADIFVYQNLQSKGYALPFRNLSVEKLIEYVWIKLEDK